MSSGGDHQADSQTMRQSDRNQILATRGDDAARADEDQRECTDELDNGVLVPVFFHHFPRGAWAPILALTSVERWPAPHG